jgi:long-subunit fatty acid transport protein
MRGLVSVNFGIGFNKLQNNTQRFSVSGRSADNSFPRGVAIGLSGVLPGNFDRDATNTEWLAMETNLITYIAGQDGEYIGATEDFDPLDPDKIYQMGEVDQTFYRDQSGYVGEYAFNLGLNFSDKYYFGMTIGLQDISNDLYEEYQESAVNRADFASIGFHNLTHEFQRRTTGMGWNLKFGTIIRPTAGLRIGAYLHTPTWMSLVEKWDERMASSFSQRNYSEQVDGTYNYRINSPFRWGAGIAYTFGSSAIISVDYEGVYYGGLTMREEDGSVGGFLQDNKILREISRDVTTNIRAGVEYKLDDNFAVRAGYSYYQHPEKDASAMHVGSVGAGYRERFFFIDFAYSFSPSAKQYATLYSNSPIATATTLYNKFALTLGFRF